MYSSNLIVSRQNKIGKKLNKSSYDTRQIVEIIGKKRINVEKIALEWLVGALIYCAFLQSGSGKSERWALRKSLKGFKWRHHYIYYKTVAYYTPLLKI